MNELLSLKSVVKKLYFIIFLFSVILLNAQETFSESENAKIVTKSNGSIYIYKADDSNGLLSHGFGAMELDLGDVIEFQIGFLDEFTSENSLSFGLSSIEKSDSKNTIDYRVDLEDYGRNLKLYHGNTEKSNNFFPSNSTVKIKIDKYNLLYFLNNKLFLSLPRNSEDKYKIHFKILNKSNYIKGLNVEKSKVNEFNEVLQDGHEEPFSVSKSQFIRNLDGSINIIKTDKLSIGKWDSFGFGKTELETGNFIAFEFIQNKDYAAENTSLQCGISMIDKSNANSTIDYWIDLDDFAKNVNFYYNNGTDFVELKKEQSSIGRFKILVEKSHIIFYKDDIEIVKTPRKGDANFKFHYRIFDGYSGIKNLKITKSHSKYWGIDFEQLNPKTEKIAPTKKKTVVKKKK